MHYSDAAGRETKGVRRRERLVDHARSKCKCALRVVADVSNAYAVLRRRPPDGVRARGPVNGPRHNFYAYNYRWSAVTLKPDRERADTTTGRRRRRRGRSGGRSGLSDDYYLSMEIDLERCQSSRLRSISTARIARIERFLDRSRRPVVRFW